MKSYALFKQYIWLVNIIHRRGKISLSEINREWLYTDMSGGVTIARNTFLRHKNAIEDIFGIIIECDTHHDYQYYISNRHVLSEDSIQNWMLSTITVNNILSENISLADRILLEVVPSEGNFLQSIIDAMRRKVRIQLSYQKYGCDSSTTLSFAPYCLRLFQCRWYVLGQFQRPVREGEVPMTREGLPEGYTECFATYSLDRVKKIYHTDESFEIDKDFSAAAYFKYCLECIVWILFLYRRCLFAPMVCSVIICVTCLGIIPRLKSIGEKSMLIMNLRFDLRVISSVSS